MTAYTPDEAGMQPVPATFHNIDGTKFRVTEPYAWSFDGPWVQAQGHWGDHEELNVLLPVDRICWVDLHFEAFNELATSEAIDGLEEFLSEDPGA